MSNASMPKTPPHDPWGTTLIPTGKQGQPGARGIWATPAYQDGQFGILLGKTRSEDSSLAIFIPEAKFAALRKHLASAPADYREVLEEAIKRLPEFKTRTSGFSNPGRA
jgi:hypothetical protein